MPPWSGQEEEAFAVLVRRHGPAVLVVPCQGAATCGLPVQAVIKAQEAEAAQKLGVKSITPKNANDTVGLGAPKTRACLDGSTGRHRFGKVTGLRRGHGALVRSRTGHSSFDAR